MTIVLKESSRNLAISQSCLKRDVFCCDRKTPAASAQSFTLWRQATITCHNHSIITCSHHIQYMGVILRAHPVRGESHIQRNANREVATLPIPTYCACFNSKVTLKYLLILVHVHFVQMRFWLACYWQRCNQGCSGVGTRGKAFPQLFALDCI